MSDRSQSSRCGRQYLAMALRYAEAAKRLSHSGALDDVQQPFFMLVAHALELSLKAMLNRQGYDEDWLMLIGHGLERSLRRALESGLYPEGDPDLARLIDALDQPHTFQAFRYPQTGHLKVCYTDGAKPDRP